MNRDFRRLPVERGEIRAIKPVAISQPTKKARFVSDPHNLKNRNRELKQFIHNPLKYIQNKNVNRRQLPVYGLVVSTFILGLLISIFPSYDLYAAAGTVEHYKAIQSAEQICNGTTCVGGAGWYDLPNKAEIVGSNFNVGEDYLIMVWAEYNTATVNSNGGVRVRHGTTSFTDSEAREETDRNGAVNKTPYFWFTDWTATNEDIEVQMYYDGTNNTLIEDVTLVIINVEELKADGNFYSDEDTGNATLTTTWSVRSTLTFTPASATDDWWIMGYTKANTSSVTAGDAFQMQLDVAGTIVGTSRVDGEDNNDTPVRPIGWSTTLAASSQTVELEARSLVNTQQIDASGIFALNLNAFKDHAVATDTGDSPNAMDVNNQWEDHVSFSLNPTTTSDFLIAGGSVMDDNNGVVLSRIQNTTDAVSLTDEVGGWQHITDDQWPYSIASFETAIPTGSNTYAYQGRMTNSITAESQDSWMVAFSMELPEPTVTWYNIAWLYRIKITVQASEVDENVTNFPVYVDLSNLSADFHNHVKSNGGDIRVTKADGSTEVPREVVAINTTASTGELHFRAPSLSPNNNTDFYIYYGNSSATEPAVTATYGAQNVWTNGYEAVYHLEGVYTDSTSNDYDGTNNGTVADSTGQLGAARSFDGSNDSIDIELSATPAVVQTAEDTATTGTTISATFASAPTEGNHIIALVHGGASGVSTAPSGFTLVVEDSAGGGYTNIIYVKQAGASESSTVEVVFPTSNSMSIIIYEVSGLQDVADPSEYSDWDYQGSGTTVTMTGGSNNSQADVFAVASTWFWDPDETISWNNSFTEDYELHNGSNSNTGSAHKIISSVETTSVTATWGASTDGSGVFATFLAASPSIFNTEDEYTLSAWTDANNCGEGGFGNILTKDNTDLYMCSSTSAYAIYDEDAADSAVSDTSVVVTNSWAHVVVSYDGIDTYDFMVDGVDAGSDTPAWNQTNGSGSAYIGADSAGPSSSHVFDGDIDEVRISSVKRTATWLSTEYNNQNSPSTFYTDGTEESNGPSMPLITQEGYIFENEDGTVTSSGELSDWYNSSWSYRKKITVEYTEVDANLTNFPVYVDLNDLGSDFHNNVKTDGGDIRVTQSDGETEVPREVVDIDTGTADSGELHFRATSLSSTADTDFYIYYGNSSATEPAVTATYGAQNVWSNGYVGVYHLDEDCADDSAGCITDSTGNEDMTSKGFSTGGDNSVAGKLGNADHLDGIDSVHIYTEDTSSPNVGSTYSVTAWVNPDTVDDENYIFSHAYNTRLAFKLDWDSTNTYHQLHHYAYEAFSGTWPNYDVESYTRANDVTTSAWNYVAATVNGTTGKLYAHGTEISTYTSDPIDGTSTSMGVDSSYDTGIGLYRYGSNAEYVFDGTLDEIRFSDNTLTDTWLSTEYNNQNSPGTFYTIGTQTDRLSGVGFAESYTALAGSEFTTGKTLSNVSVGQRMNLRMHLTNEGAAIDATDELALFYDRSDGIWTKVERSTGSDITNGNCSDNDWDCLTADNTGTDRGQYTSTAIDKAGNPWVSYYDVTSTSLMVAQYVGVNGSGCTSDAWTCTTVDNTGTNRGEYTSIAFDDDGDAWVSYYDATTTQLMVANFVGSGGSGCTSSAWTCEAVDNTGTNTGQWTSIAMDSGGKPWVSYYDVTNGSLRAAHRDTTGFGSTCTDADWRCGDVDADAADIGKYSSMAFDREGAPWISYYDETADSLMVAEYVATSGTGCGGTTEWSCETVDDTGTTTGQYSSIAFGPTGDVPWVSYYDSTNTDLRVAHKNSTGFGSTCTDTDWRCGIVESTGTVGLWTSIAFAPDGNPWVSYYDDDATATNKALKVARHVGSGGTGCADTAWTGCAADTDTNGSDAVGEYSSLAFAPDGKAWLSYYDGGTETSLKVANIARTGEIVLTPGIYSSPGDALTTSHADMTSATDTTGAGDADCLVGSTTWNNGSWVGARENATTLSVAKGDTTAQCSEIAWTIDTSQAIGGETYRFIVATNDGWRRDKSAWRGPIDVATDGYPTMTMADDNEIRYAKDNQATFADCDDTDWGCELIDGGTEVGGDISIAMDPEGTPWLSYYTGGTEDNLTVATYVGSGGTGCSDSTAWDCIDIDTTGDVGSDSSIIFDQNGTAWISYKDVTNTTLKVAKYVGSGGTGCAVTSWSCTTVISANNVGDDTDIAIDKNNNPWILYYDVTGANLNLAHYVGGGAGNGNCASTDWSCEIIDSTDDVGREGALAFSPEGMPWIAYKYTTGLDLYAAHYVGSGGTGCDTVAWTCEAVDVTNSVADGGLDITFNADGDPVIGYLYLSNNDLRSAKYVGSGGDCDSLYGGSDAWDCDAVHTTNNVGLDTAIASDSNGNPWVVSRDSTATYMVVTKYVGGSSGNCTNTAWSCESVNNVDFRNNSIAFDNSGTPWIASYANIGGAWITKLHLSPNKLTASAPISAGDRNAGSGDARYRLDPGTVPYSKQSQGTCGSAAGATGYCGLFHDEGHFDSMYAGINEKVLYTFSKRFPSNAEMPSATAFFQTDLAPSSSSVVMQVYRHGTTNTWETLTIDSTSSNCSTASCQIDGIPTGTLGEYFEADGSDYWTHFRIYQNDSASTGFTLEFDSFRAIQTRSLLRHGAGFSDNLITPLGF